MLKYHDIALGKTVDSPGKIDGTGSLEIQRGNVPLDWQFCAGNTNVAAPAGVVSVWFGLKAQDDMKGPWLANVQLAAVVGSAGLFRAVLACNTPEMIAAMHADPADETPEDKEIIVYGQLYYFLDGVADPVASQIIAVTVTAVLWNGVEGIAPSPNVLGPTVAQIPINLADITQRVPTVGLPASAQYSLSHVATVGRAPGTLFFFTEAATGKLVAFRLESGPATVGDDNQVAPVDYDADTNDMHFALVPTGGSAAPTGAYDCTNAQRLTGGNGARTFQFGDIVNVTDQGGRSEQFLGPLAGEAGAGCTVAGASVGDGTYTQSGGHFNPVDVNAAVFIGQGASGVTGGWSIISDTDGQIDSLTGGDYPWDVTWPDGVSVARNDAASNANWLVLRNTINLTVSNQSYTCSVADQGCFGGDDTNVGWVFEDAIPFESSYSSTYIGQVFGYTFGRATVTRFPLYANSGTTVFALPVPAGPRASVTILLLTD